MKKSIFCFLCLLILPLLLTACGDDETPSGYMLMTDPARDGAYIYVPESWTTDGSSGVATAYVSSLNSARLTFTRLSTDATDVASYWSQSETGFSTLFDEGTYAFTAVHEMSMAGYPAYLYEYTLSYDGTPYRFMQYLIVTGEGGDPSRGLYALTYSASTSENVSGGNDFDDTVGEMENILGYMKFSDTVNVIPSRPDLADTEADAPEGMKLASNPAYLGLSLYVPDDFTVDMSTGYVSAYREQIFVGIADADYAGAYSLAVKYEIPLTAEGNLTVGEYIEVLRRRYAELYTDFTMTDVPTGENGQAVFTEYGESVACSFSYTGTLAGRTFQGTCYLLREKNGGNNRWYLLTGMAEGDETVPEDLLTTMLTQIDY